MRLMLASLRFWIKRRIWRSKNKHNKTILASNTAISNITVGNYTYGGLNVLNDSSNYFLKIGHYCSIAQGVTFIVCADHPTSTISSFPFKVMCLGMVPGEAISRGNIIVEDDVWLGYNVTVLSGVKIGQGAVVAAGALVTRDVPPYAVVGGVPARVIKYRFPPHIIDALLEVDYGKLTKEMIEKHIHTLYEELADSSQLEWLPRKDS